LWRAQFHGFTFLFFFAILYYLSSFPVFSRSWRQTWSAQGPLVRSRAFFILSPFPDNTLCCPLSPSVQLFSLFSFFLKRPPGVFIQFVRRCGCCGRGEGDLFSWNFFCPPHPFSRSRLSFWFLLFFFSPTLLPSQTTFLLLRLWFSGVFPFGRKRKQRPGTPPPDPHLSFFFLVLPFF